MSTAERKDNKALLFIIKTVDGSGNYNDVKLFGDQDSFNRDRDCIVNQMTDAYMELRPNLTLVEKKIIG